MALLKSISPSTLTDPELVNLYRLKKQQHILAELYLRYSDLLYGTCVKYLGDQEKAKDAVMDIYQELIPKLLHHEVDNFKSWVYVLAKNHCLMYLRRNKKMQTSELNPAFVQSEDFSHLEGLIAKENRLNRLHICIEQLQEEQKQSVRLFYLDNKCYNEITALTGLDWNKVRSLIQNGRRNLKICMEKNVE